MKTKLFFDSDVILDATQIREPHYESYVKLLSQVDEEIYSGFTSSIIFLNIYYLQKMYDSHKTAVQFLKKIRLLFKVLPVDDKIIYQALESKFADFEDAVQYHTALSNKMDYIITRNINHYKLSDITVLSPTEFLKRNN